MNSEFLANIRVIFGSDGEAWLRSLPDTVDQLRQAWDLHNIVSVADLSYNYCFFAESKDGQKFVVKIAPNHKTYRNEVRALQSFLAGVPRVFAVSSEHQAYLMECFIPGGTAKSLVQAGDDDEATRVIAKTIRRLQAKPDADGFMHLSEFIPSLDILKARIDAHDFEKLQTTFRNLTVNRSNDVLLHGDLHHGNVLQHGSEWLAIDPHGYIGHPVAEIGAMIRNPWDAFPSNLPLRKVVDRRIEILKEELCFDLQLMNAWAFCITALSEVWSLEDQGPTHRVDLEFLSVLESRVF